MDKKDRAVKGNRASLNSLSRGKDSKSAFWGQASSLLHDPGLSSRVARRTMIALCSVGVLLLCRWLAYELRFDFDVPSDCQEQLRQDWPWVIALQMFSLLVFGQFSGIYRYFSLPEIRRLAFAMGLSAFSLYAVRYFWSAVYSPPSGVILLQCMLGLLALGGLRAGWRLTHELYFSRKGDHYAAAERRIAIIGAGDAGASLVRELAAHPNLRLMPAAFFDDNPRKWRSRIHGVPVLGPPEQLAQTKLTASFQEAVIAMPSASPKRLGEVVTLLQKAELNYVTVPSLDQLTSGRVKISQLRPVKIEDLLGRQPVDLRHEEIGRVLENRTVMVTGAGGSIGSELCRQVAAFRPRRLLLVDQSEVQLFQIEQELIKLGCGSIIVPLIGDILDRDRIRTILERFQAAVIFHAAAHKHVPMMENQPSEAIKNNALATVQLAQLALDTGVERFVMISTDKAVNPTSVMGASKRLAEVFLQAFAQRHPNRTRFVAVRFGNVLGSSGSVVPIFERQIAEGGPITVTHPDVVRYFMTIPEAVGLVLQSCAQGEGGEIFVLDMGKPVKIAELARQMIRLSGLQPERDIQIKYIGLRPGEKLFEELQHLQADCTATSHPRIKCLTSRPRPLEQVLYALDQFNGELHTASAQELKLRLKAILPEYTPYLPEGKPKPECAHAYAEPPPVYAPQVA